MKYKQLAEPVAVRYDFDGYGYLYMDAGSGSDWASRVKNCEPLYTHPMRDLTDEEILEKAINIFGVQRLEMLDDIYWTSFAKAIIKASRGEE